MARPRHAIRVHPLRTKGVAVGIPVAAAVAFGAHSVLGVTPLSDQQDTSTSAAPEAAAPVQAYGLAQAPPPTTLGLLSSPVDQPAGAATGGTTGSSSGTTTSPIAGATAGKTSTHRIAAPSQTVPIAPAAAAPKPSMMTFSGGGESASSPAPAPAAQRSAPAETHDEAPQQEESRQEAAPQQQGGGGGALLGVDLGVAKVSVLSFG